MTTDQRHFDDLDRLGFRLRRVIRDQHPQLATHGFTLRDLEERLLPVHETRRELADGSTGAWERLILRLSAGERDLVSGDPALQEACRQALALPTPTLSLVRAWGSHVMQLAGTGTPAGGIPSTSPHGQCRYCSGGLPDRAHITFCPHCGLDLTKRQCPACSTELEVHWRFCVTCGRRTALGATDDATDGTTDRAAHDSADASA